MLLLRQEGHPTYAGDGSTQIMVVSTSIKLLSLHYQEMGTTQHIIYGVSGIYMYKRPIVLHICWLQFHVGGRYICF